MKRLTVDLLPGDMAYRFTCRVCNYGEEYFEKLQKSWYVGVFRICAWIDVLKRLEITHLALYNLASQNRDRPFFRWKEEVCNFIDVNWERLCSPKTRSATWHHTVMWLHCSSSLA